MELVFLILLIVLMILALSSGFPVAFALPGSAILSIALAALCGYLMEGDVSAYFAQDGPSQWLSAGVTNFRSLYWIVERDTLIAIPLFVFMGIMLQRSKIAEDLLVAMAQLFGPVPGGLGISVVFVGALLAATTGIVGATVIAMGLISLPAMLRNNYDKSLACGTICASGTLGQIIPPSIVLIILADQLSSASDQASTARKADYKEATGEFAMPSELDITSASAGDMFMGALIPGMILVGLYMLYILVTAIMRPNTAPPVPYDGQYDRKFVFNILLALIPPLALIFAVLGSIVLGVATVNQAGAIGAVGAIIMAGYRLKDGQRHAYTPAIISAIALITILLLSHYFDLNIKNIKSQHSIYGIIMAVTAVSILLGMIAWSAWRAYKIDDTLSGVMIDTAKTTSMVFIILIGAAMLTSAFRGFGGEELVKDYLTSLPGGFWTQFIVVMAVIFLLGFFLDFIEIAVVVVPIVAPILLADPEANVTAVWLGVMIGLNIQTSFLTPPFGFSLFYLRGVAPSSIKTTHIYKGAVAFIALQLIGLSIAGYFPSLVNYLPSRTHLTSETAPPPINPKLQWCIEEMLFDYYEENQNSLSENINRAKAINLSVLPESKQHLLTESFNKASMTFELVKEIQQTQNQLDLLSTEYRPLHSDVRSINKSINSLADEISELDQSHRRLTRNQATDSTLYAIETEISILEYRKNKLHETIPDQWTEKHDQYNVLSDQLKIAQQNYRRNSDSSYKAVSDILQLLEQNKMLQDQENQFLALTNLNTMPVEQAIDQIKQLEASINSLAGLSKFRDTLSETKRALKKQPADWQKANNAISKSIDMFYAETLWRDKAAPILPELQSYNESIKSSIGLRLQPRLNIDQAKQIALCQSHHRDISLHF